MDKEFVPYDVAIQLRDLGMLEPCYSFWAGLLPGKLPFLLPESERTTPIRSWEFICPAPTYRQAFTFMRNRFRLYPSIEFVQGVAPAGWEAWVKSPIRLDCKVGEYASYKNAELACLRYMIGSVQPIRKFNGGDGADLCPVCRRILPEGNRGYSESIDQQPVQ
jgi:hypothetical protein